MNLLDIYSKLPLEPVRARGYYLTSQNGQKYLDFYSGHGVISVGHCHPQVTAALHHQSEKLAYYSNAVHSPVQEEFATKLCQISGYHDYRVFFSNSGTEAVENALKTACYITGRTEIVSFSRSFHGRSSLALAVSDACPHKSAYNDHFPVHFLPWDDANAAADVISTSTAAVIIEGIQGVGGIRSPEKKFLRKLKSLCEQHQTLLILDEVQSGAGRSGDFFAHQNSQIKADIVTQAKGLGNGYPLAATLFHPDIKLPSGYLGSTFGGAPLASAVGLAVLNCLESEDLLNNATVMGDSLLQGLKENPLIESVTGRGLMLGFSCGEKTPLVQKGLFHHGVLTGTARGGLEIRLLPPLCIDPKAISLFMKKLNMSLNEAELL